MTDILEKLYAVPETGADPELIDEAAAEIERLKAELDAAKADAALTRCQLKESRADEMQAMAYLNQIREVIGGADYPHTVKIAHGLKRMVDEMEAQEPVYYAPNNAVKNRATTMLVGLYAVNPTDVPLYTRPVPSVPEGYQLVPIKPTSQMLVAFSHAAEGVRKRHLLSGSYPALWQPWIRSAARSSEGGIMTPTIEAAHEMGAKGAPHNEAERLAFEAWMRGHCWSLSAVWDGECYRGSAEHGENVDYRAMLTRQLWAAWRDRAALASPVPSVPERLTPDGKYGKQHHYAEGWNDCIDAILQAKEES